MAKMSEKCLRMASIKSSSYGFPSEMSHQKCWELGEKYIEEMGIEIHVGEIWQVQLSEPVLANTTTPITKRLDLPLFRGFCAVSSMETPHH